MLKGLAKVVAALNGNVKKTQIAAGFAWGILLGLLPSLNAIWICLFVLSFCFRHHHASKVLCLAILKALSPILAPPIDALGWEALHIASLENFYTGLYNSPVVLFTRFNNTLVVGGLLAGVTLFIPIFVLITLFVPLYRRTLLPKIVNSRIVKAVNSMPLMRKFRGYVDAFSDIKETLDV